LNLFVWIVTVGGLAAAALMVAGLTYAGLGGLKDGKAGWWPLIFVALLIGIGIRIMM
jgi:hypothetical protein